jgi:hypothetical protein
MTDLVSPALRGLRWQYAVGRIDLATLERKIEERSHIGSGSSTPTPSTTTTRHWSP